MQITAASAVPALVPGMLWAATGEAPAAEMQSVGKLVFVLVMVLLLSFVLAHELPRNWPALLRWILGGVVAVLLVWGLFWL